MKLTTVSLLSLGERFLKTREISSPRFCSEELLRHVLKKDSRFDLYQDNHSCALKRNEIKTYFSLLRKRGVRFPLQYITEEVGFLDFTLRVCEGVFIPRPETERLVIETVERLRIRSPRSILDIGTGTGNIAISIASYFPAVDIVAVDTSDEALALAAENACRNGVYERIAFHTSDCFSDIEDGRTFDCIISNPPYIAYDDLSSLAEEVHAEPMSALSDGWDGLTFYRRIIQEAESFLNPDGILAFEIGYNQAAAVCSLLQENNFKNSTVYKDYAQYDRVVIAER